MKKNILISLLAFTTLICFSQERMQSGIIYGHNHAFSLTAPNGWILDNQSGIDQGIYVVFYEEGYSWADAVTVMYANTASLKDSVHNTLEALIEYDMNDFRSTYSDLVITDEDSIKIDKKTTAIVKYLSGESYGNFEAIAYIDAGKTGVVIVMSSRTKEGFDNSLKAFEKLVKSYFFMAEDVIIQEK